MWRKHLPLVLILLVFGILYSYKLLDVPTGLTVDEASFGYNATLLSKTGRDENGIARPVFILSIDHSDWRQPVMQYYLTALFYLFGPSFWLLRFSSVILALVSAFLLYLLLLEFVPRKFSLLGVVLFLATPVFFMHGRLGLDNIMPVPWTLAWLLFLIKGRQGNARWLLLAGFVLGVNFYSYKAMRAVVPVWTLLSLGYLWLTTKKERLKKIFFLALGLAPFILVIPHLESHYAGAVFDRHGFAFGNIYDFVYPYISSFDWSFLFIKGDSTWFHSTQKHGVFLLSLLPLYLAGIYYAVKNKSHAGLLLLAFLLAPILFGMVNSVYRASRLIYLVPLAIGFSTWGLYQVSKTKWAKWVLPILAVVMIINFVDFTRYYFVGYPIDARTNHAFGDLKQYLSYKKLAETARENGAKPYLAVEVDYKDGQIGKFAQTVYFGRLIDKWNSDAPPEGPAVLLSLREDIPGAQRVETPGLMYYVHLVR